MASDSAQLGPTWALVPLKRTADAKRRLGDLLDPEARRRLVLAMFEDVLAGLAAALTPDGLAGILVVTDDPAAASVAARYQAQTLADPGPDAGTTRAVAAGLRALAERGAGAALVLPADLPLLTAGEIRLLLAGLHGRRRFVIVPARDGRGSNAVLMAPPDAMALVYDGDSVEPHLRSARQAGLEPTVLHLTGIGLDIDTPADLLALAAHPDRLESRTGRLLHQWRTEGRPFSGPRPRS